MASNPINIRCFITDRQNIPRLTIQKSQLFFDLGRLSLRAKKKIRIYIIPFYFTICGKLYIKQFENNFKNQKVLFLEHFLQKFWKIYKIYFKKTKVKQILLFTNNGCSSSTKGIFIHILQYLNLQIKQPKPIPGYMLTFPSKENSMGSVVIEILSFRQKFLHTIELKFLFSNFFGCCLQNRL